VLSFQKKFPEAIEYFKEYWFQYMQYCYWVELGEEAPTVQNRTTYSLMDLDRDEKGFPMLPPVGEKETLQDLKAMVRSFVTAHYRELAKIYIVCLLKIGRFCFWSPT
jgi:broad specificity phosphatase PhoE